LRIKSQPARLRQSYRTENQQIWKATAIIEPKQPQENRAPECQIVFVLAASVRLGVSAGQKKMNMEQHGQSHYLNID
jgi:hypothetical protein